MNYIKKVYDYIINHEKYTLVYLFINYYVWYFVFYRVKKYSVGNYDEHTTLVYLFALPFSFIAVLLLVYRFRISYIIFSAITIYMAMFLARYLHISGGIGIQAIESIYQTNPSESFEYVVKLFSFKTFKEFTLFFVVIGFLVFLKAPNNYKKITLFHNINFVNYGFVVAVSIYLIFDVYKVYLNDIATSFKNYKTSKSYVLEMLQNIKNNGIEYELKANNDIDIIVIVGESLSKHHMSVYGYEKATTPNLENYDIIKFNDVISPHSFTDPSLSQILTLADDTKHRYFSDFDSYAITKILSEAGFHTSWLSNQFGYGVWDNKASTIARQADYFMFLTDDYYAGYGNYKDGELLKHLPNAIKANRNNAVFLHFYSSHFAYKGRYPAGFKEVSKWDKYKLGLQDVSVDEVAQYDTAIKYTDTVVKEVFDFADKQAKPTVVLFVPDHGENVMNGTGHDSAKYHSWHVEIPFIFYANSSYKQQYPNKINEISSNINKPYNTVDLPYSIMDLAGITAISQTKKKSIFSANFIPLKRTTISGFVAYDDKNRNVDSKGWAGYHLKSIENRLGKKYTDKILSYGGSTIMQAKMTRGVFKGIELDVVYDSKKDIFDIYSPLRKSRNFSFEEYLQYVPHKDFRVWLDWKNPSGDNIKSAINRLNYLNGLYNIKSTIVIDVAKQFKDISLLSQNGYKQSYHLLSDKSITDCIKNATAECETIASKIKHNLSKNNFAGISFNVDKYEFYQKYLKSYVNDNNLSVYLWDTNTQIGNKDFRINTIYKYLYDKNIKAIAIQYNTGYSY